MIGESDGSMTPACADRVSGTATTDQDDLAGFADMLDRYLGGIAPDRGGDDIWQSLVDTFGLGGIGVPADRGGMGPATAEAILVATALGRAALALPWGQHWVATRLGANTASVSPGLPIALTDQQALAHARDSNARDWGIAALAMAEAAEMTGLCETMLTDTIAFATERRQFGTSIAGFQVLRHRIVDMQLALEKSRAMTRLATYSLDSDTDGASRSSSTAWILAHDACVLVGEAAVQIHGAMGLTRELRLSRFFRRALLLCTGRPLRRQHVTRVLEPM